MTKVVSGHYNLLYHNGFRRRMIDCAIADINVAEWVLLYSSYWINPILASLENRVALVAYNLPAYATNTTQDTDLGSVLSDHWRPQAAHCGDYYHSMWRPPVSFQPYAVSSYNI
jgi:hypothetical protein